MNAIEITKMGVAQLNVRATPRKTGNMLEKSVEARNLYSQDGISRGTIKIGGDVAPYAVYLQYCDTVGASDKPNRHKNWVNIWIKNELIPAVKKGFKK